MSKLILLGSFLTVISVFMPWYRDIDKFKTGDMFLGLTGPTYLAGILVLLSGGAILGWLIMKLMDKTLPKLPLKEEHLFIILSGLSVLMLIQTSSVYFHPKFGMNLTEKTMGFGMVLAFIGAGAILLGGILSLKKKAVNFDTAGEMKPLIDMEMHDRVQNSLQNEPKQPQRSEQPFSPLKGKGQDMAQKSMEEIYGNHNTNDLR